MCNWNLYDCIHVSIPATLRSGYLCNWETHYGGEYGLEIPTSFDFYEHERAIKLAKEQNNKDRR